MLVYQDHRTIESEEKIMAKIVEKVKLDVNIQFTITEEEARSL